MKTTLVFFFLFVSTYCQSQISGAIINELTSDAVPYASVFAVRSKIGTYTDSLGKFRIEAKHPDTLVIRIIDYKELRIYVEKPYQLIRLREDSMLLNEVVYKIKVIQPDTPILLERSLKKITNFMGARSGFEYTRFFDHDKQKCTPGCIIERLSINCKYFPKFSNGTLRLHIYSVDASQGLPGKDLLTQLVELKSRELTKNVNFDLSPYGIKFPSSGLFIGFEWISTDSNSALNPFIGFTNKISEFKTYSRSFFAENKWKLLTLDSELNQILKEKKPLNLTVNIYVR